MGKYVGRNIGQKEFVKLFEGLCGKYSRHEVWQDFIWMAATAISNAVDKRFFEQREARYLDTIGKYTPEEQKVFPKLFALVVNGMDRGPDQDYLGELYMLLNLGNPHSGQFFTPYDVCLCMANIDLDSACVKASLEKHGYISIADPACGAGATLIAAANCLRARHINYQTQAIFFGQDIDYTVALMCYIQLSLMGCAGYVRIGDSICDPATGPVLSGMNDEYTWYTPFFFMPHWNTIRAIEKLRKTFPEFDKPEEVPEEVPTIKEEAPTIVLKKEDCGEQLEGQIMFQF